MNDIIRTALTNCILSCVDYEDGYKAPFRQDGLLKDVFMQDCLKLIFEESVLTPLDLTKNMAKNYDVLLPPRVLTNFAYNGTFGVNGI